jgi:large subunit ribosomal protein L22
MAALIRGVEVNKALDLLKYSNKDAAASLEKLLMSAIANWQAKNEGVRIEDSHLFVKEAYVDSARSLKRIRPAPQGRAYRIRKRSNHVTLLLESGVEKEMETETKTVSENEKTDTN